MLGERTTGIFLAAAFISLISVSENPVVPITMALEVLMASTRCSIEAFGLVKSTSTSPRRNDFRYGVDYHRVAGAYSRVARFSTAPAISNSLSNLASLMILAPFFPAAPQIVILIILILHTRIRLRVSGKKKSLVFLCFDFHYPLSLTAYHCYLSNP